MHNYLYDSQDPTKKLPRLLSDYSCITKWEIETVQTLFKFQQQLKFKSSKKEMFIRKSKTYTGPIWSRLETKEIKG